MDIQKEEDDFNAWFNKQTINAVPDADLSLQRLWASLAWQAAKTQAVPEGFVLVPKQPTPKMIDATWNFDEEIQDMSHNSRNEFIYNAMIEAQEQSHE